MPKRKFNRNKCTNTVRAVIHFGDQVITLVGKHAFEWSIVKEEPNKISITTFHTRETAVNEFNKYK